jgi:hypothetical protein
LFLCVAAALMGCGVAPGGPPVALRAEHFTVTPATGPVTHVLVHNLLGRTYRGTIIAEFPDAWKVTPAQRRVTIQPGQTARVPFAIERAANTESNSYVVRIKAVGAGTEVAAAQTIVCASAPYSKPSIGGTFDPDQWKQAIPVTFTTGGKKTTISTFWSRQSFSLLVAVEEESLQPLGEEGADAVQIALSPRDATTPTSPAAAAERWEFLLAATQAGPRCFMLIQPGQPLSLALQPRPLAGLEVGAAAVAVTRKAPFTYYECSIPFKDMPALQPETGREFCLGFLVHDGDGTGLRDWGQAAGLWPWQRNRLAWCSWPGAQWPKDAPFDNKIEWGFSSSRQ